MQPRKRMCEEVLEHLCMRESKTQVQQVHAYVWHLARQVYVCVYYVCRRALAGCWPTLAFNAIR
jgi:hypothetical protein